MDECCLTQTLAQYPYAEPSRYPGSTEPGSSRNAYARLGAGSVLLELRGGIGSNGVPPHPGQGETITDG